MKRIYTMIKAISAMLLMVLLFTACTKSAATPESNDSFTTPDAMPDSKVVIINSNTEKNIGTITLSKEQEGNAKVVLNIRKETLKLYSAPYQAMLRSSTLPTANLKSIDPATGISETYPVISSNKGLVVSHNSLMFMRDLQLVIYDKEEKVIAVVDVQ